jgi:outer membrane protein TolC
MRFIPRFILRFMTCLAFTSLWFGLSPASAGELTLRESENLTLARDPMIEGFQAKARALSETAIADGQLPDPEIKAGIMNLPEDTFSTTQENMTQVQIGVRQSFPRGDTLSLRTRKGMELSEVERARRRNRGRTVLLEVRKNWLDLYYLNQATEIIKDNKKLFRQLIDVTESLYALGRNNQQDVVSAELELNLLEDRETEIAAMRDMAIADLARWVGPENASRHLPATLPELPTPLPLNETEARLPDHPLMQAEDAELRASRTAIDLANELYKPKWMVDLTQSFRQGDNTGRTDARADFLSFMVTMDVPIFTDKRQDRRVAASRQQAAAAGFRRDDRLRELQRTLARQYAAWNRLGERVELYEKAVLARAGQNVEASIKAYQSDVTDFTGLMRAQITELDTRLKWVQVRVERAKAQAAILYLSEEVYLTDDTPAPNQGSKE